MRMSNMELLRIVSMLFVLILHANFIGIDVPTKVDLDAAPLSTFIRCFTEASAIVAVDVFVLISGWFGIRFSIKKLSAFLFQVMFFSFGFFIVFSFINPSETFTIDRIKGIFLLNGDYWFVKAYLILFILSPVLNAFVERASKKEFIIFLVSFYTFHTLYGWLMDASVAFTMNGTTGLSFIGLYMLGRYVRLCPSRFTSLSKEKDLAIYLGGVLLLCCFNLLFLYLNHSVTLSGRLYSYASPVVILSSLYLLLFFSKLSFKNKTVNWIASSCFAVYLFHCNSFFFSAYYRDLIKVFYASSYSVCGVILYVIFIFFISVLIDKIRMRLWNVGLKVFQR